MHFSLKISSVRHNGKKNDFPKKYILKAFATVASVVLEAGGGCVTLPLSAWGATSLSPKCPLPLARGPGLTSSHGGVGLRLGDPVLVAALQCREGAWVAEGRGTAVSSAPPLLHRGCVLRPSPDFTFMVRVHGRARRAVEVLRELLGIGEGPDDPEAGGAVWVSDEAFVGALGCAD